MEYIKICGLKDPLHVKLCIEYGANAVGFIYNVPESPRNLEKSELLNLLKEIPKNFISTIVLKPSNISEIKDVMEDIKANYYQIHVDFDLQEVNNLSSEMKKKIILALKVNQANKKSIIKLINKYYNQFFAFLIDNSEGHGAKLNFELVSEILNKINKTNIILAGGINYENVKEIILKLKPFGIDVSSSLESERGVKDPVKIKNFLEKVNEIKK